MDLSKKNIGLPVLVLFLSACTSPQIANIKYIDDAVVEQAAKTTQTPQQVCEAASMAIANANKEDFNFFAPLHLEQASDNLKKGQDKIKTKKTQAEGIKYCLKVNQLVKNGLRVKAKVKSSLIDALDELDRLKKIDEEKKFTGDIQGYIDDVIDLIKEIEEGKMNAAMQGQAELLKGMQKLEITIVLNKNLRPVEAMIERADDADADELARKTFEKAKAELQSARKFIRIYYRNREQVKNVSAIAMRKARHAYYVAKEVETLVELKPNAAEEKVLYIESLLERINKKFNQDVVTGYSLYEQTSIIGKRLDTVIDAKASASRDLAIIKQQRKDNLATEKSSPQKLLAPEAQVQTPSDKTSIAAPVTDQTQQSPVNEVRTTQPIAQQVQQSPVDDAPNTQPIAQQVQQSPVDDVPNTQPIAQQVQQSPVNEVRTTQPIAQQVQQSPVNEIRTTQPIAQQVQQSPVDETKTVNPVTP